MSIAYTYLVDFILDGLWYVRIVHVREIMMINVVDCDRCDWNACNICGVICSDRSYLMLSPRHTLLGSLVVFLGEEDWLIEVLTRGFKTNNGKWNHVAENHSCRTDQCKEAKVPHYPTYEVKSMLQSHSRVE